MTFTEALDQIANSREAARNSTTTASKEARRLAKLAREATRKAKETGQAVDHKAADDANAAAAEAHVSASRQFDPGTDEHRGHAEEGAAYAKRSWLHAAEHEGRLPQPPVAPELDDEAEEEGEEQAEAANASAPDAAMRGGPGDDAPGDFMAKALKAAEQADDLGTEESQKQAAAAYAQAQAAALLRGDYAAAEKCRVEVLRHAAKARVAVPRGTRPALARHRANEQAASEGALKGWETRRGKIEGTTESGKDIDTSKMPEEHTNFSPDDHDEAASLLRSKAGDVGISKRFLAARGQSGSEKDKQHDEDAINLKAHAMQHEIIAYGKRQAAARRSKANEQAASDDGFTFMANGDGYAPNTDSGLTRVQLAPYGDFPHGGGLQRFTREDAKAIVNEWEGLNKVANPAKWMGIPWYVGHPDHPAFKDRYKDGRAVGRVKQLEAGNDGLYGLVKFNQIGKELVNTEQFHGHSVNWRVRQDGGVWRPFSLKSVGFTNEPNIPVQPVLKANEGEEQAEAAPAPEAGDDVAELAGRAAQAYEDGENPAAWVGDEDVWEKAKAAADKTYDREDEAYWPSVVTIYRNMGGTIANEQARDEKGRFASGGSSSAKDKAWDKVKAARDEAQALSAKASTAEEHEAAALAHYRVRGHARVLEEHVGFLGKPGTSDTAEIAKTSADWHVRQADRLRAKRGESNIVGGYNSSTGKSGVAAFDNEISASNEVTLSDLRAQLQKLASADERFAKGPSDPGGLGPIGPVVVDMVAPDAGEEAWQAVVQCADGECYALGFVLEDGTPVLDAGEPQCVERRASYVPVEGEEANEAGGEGTPAANEISAAATAAGGQKPETGKDDEVKLNQLATMIGLPEAANEETIAARLAMVFANEDVQAWCNANPEEINQYTKGAGASGEKGSGFKRVRHGALNFAGKSLGSVRSDLMKEGFKHQGWKDIGTGIHSEARHQFKHDDGRTATVAHHPQKGVLWVEQDEAANEAEQDSANEAPGKFPPWTEQLSQWKVRAEKAEAELGNCMESLKGTVKATGVANEAQLTTCGAMRQAAEAALANEQAERKALANGIVEAALKRGVIVVADRAKLEEDLANSFGETVLSLIARDPALRTQSMVGAAGVRASNAAAASGGDRVAMMVNAISAEEKAMANEGCKPDYDAAVKRAKAKNPALWETASKGADDKE